MAIPTDIATLWAWHKTGALSYNEGDQVLTWPDSSGNGRTLTGMTFLTTKPQFRANQLAGYPAVEVTASLQNWLENTTAGWAADLASHTAFLVWKGKSGAPGGGIVSSNNGAGSECFYQSSASQVSARWSNTVPTQFTATVNWALGEYHFGCRFQNGATQIGISVDGGSEVTTNLSGSRFGSLAPTLFFGIDGGTFADGYIVESIIYSSNLSGGNKTLINDYLRDKYFGAAPGQQEQMRDVLSRKLWLRRRPSGLFEATVPLWMLDADIGERIAAEWQIGPAPAAAGWGGKKWQRRAFTVQSVDVIAGEDGPKALRVVLLDRRPLDVLLWDNARTDRRNAAARQAGVARLTKGVGFTFARLSKAWIENPADPTAIVECAQTERAINQTGEYLEEARTNEITRSSSVSGTTGLTLAGTGTNGSAIATDTTDLFFDQATSAQSLKFTAGNPHAAELRVSYPATASVLANSNVRVSIDHKTDSGQGLFWRLTRSIDSWFWNDSGATWQAGTVDNSMPTHSDRDPSDRYFSKKIGVGGSNTTLTLAVFLQTGGTASRISHLYHAQIEVGSFPTSRIVTDGAAVTRVKTQLSHEVTTGLKLFDPALGAFYCEFVPDWSSSELGASEWMSLFWMETAGGADHMVLLYDPNSGAWTFDVEVGAGTVQATKTASVTRGVPVKIGARWTGAEGELGLTNYTISVFVDGVKGTDAVSAAPTFTSPETLWRGSSAAGDHHANGVVREVRVLPYAPSDQEMAALP